MPLLEAMNDRGTETVLDALRAADITSRLISEWFTTPTWTESSAYFTEHADQLKTARGTAAAERS